ncbi:MAG: HAMP domain-containing sensor histidine kinase [Bacteroidetes bacterium]|nr:HAMP domain-containing sensor histidine kinase [Bacteroidota bacterium]
MLEEKDNAVNALKEVVNSFTDPRLKDKKLITRPEWHIIPDSGDFDLLLSLFDNKVIVVVISGKVTTEFGYALSALVTDILKEIDHDKVSFVGDSRGITKIAWSARKIIRASYEELSQQLGHFYHIISPNLEGYFKIYLTFFPESKKHTSFIKSLEEGLLMNLNEDNTNKISSKPSREELNPESLSREELITLYYQKEEDLKSLKRRELECMEQIFHVIRQITWDDKFQPEILSTDDEDFSTLYTALNVVQDNVFEMIQQYKSLNAELEHKVTLRTVELQNKNNQLEKVNRELDVFLHSTYHDLKRPLDSIHSMIKLLREDYFDMEFDDSLQMIEKSVKKLEAFIKEIANYAKNKSESVALVKINLKDLIENAIEEEIVSLDEKPEFTTSYDLNSDLYTDSFRLNLIVANIVSNATKFAKNSETHKVDVSVLIDKDKSVIKVKDSGVGIPPEYYHKIFNPFFRSNTPNAGSGLGLYIAKQAAEKIGANIDFDSNESGTEFIIEVPNLKLITDTIQYIPSVRRGNKDVLRLNK